MCILCPDREGTDKTFVTIYCKCATDLTKNILQIYFALAHCKHIAVKWSDHVLFCWVTTLDHFISVGIYTYNEPTIQWKKREDNWMEDGHILCLSA